MVLEHAVSNTYSLFPLETEYDLERVEMLLRKNVREENRVALFI